MAVLFLLRFGSISAKKRKVLAASQSKPSGLDQISAAPGAEVVKVSQESVSDRRSPGK